MIQRAKRKLPPPKNETATTASAPAKALPVNFPEAPGAIPITELFCRYEAKRLRGASAGTGGHYYTTISHFREFLGHEPMTDDLFDDRVSEWMHSMIDSRGIVVETAVSYVKKLLALWRFGCRQRIVDAWPEVELIRCPGHDPLAWTEDEVKTIFRAVRLRQGWIGQIPESEFWPALLSVFFDSAERLGAVLAIRPEDVNLAGAWITFRAETRKGKLRDRGIPLHPQTVDNLRLILDGKPKRRFVFEAPFCEQTLRDKYKSILRDAGLPHDRKRLFHCIRKTIASHFEAAGYDATELLDHSMRKVTTDSYISPQIVKRARPSTVLFRPEKENAKQEGDALRDAQRSLKAQRGANLIAEYGDTIEAWTELYLIDHETGAETRKQYIFGLRRFEKFLDRPGTLADLTAKVIWQFAAWLIEDGIAETTAEIWQGNLSRVRRFAITWNAALPAAVVSAFCVSRFSALSIRNSRRNVRVNLEC